MKITSHKRSLEPEPSKSCDASTSQKEGLQADNNDTENVGSGSKDSLLHLKVDESRGDQDGLDATISNRSTNDAISLETRDVSQGMKWNCGSDALAQSSLQIPEIKKMTIMDKQPKSSAGKAKQKHKRKEEDILRSKLREADRQ